MLPNELNVHAVESTPSRRMLALEGALTIHNAQLFASALRKEHAPTTVLDLHAVPHMDSAGMGALIHYYVTCRKQGRKLILTGVQPRVDALLELTKVKALLIVIPAEPKPHRADPTAAAESPDPADLAATES